MGQLGIMLYFMLPVAVRAGRTSLLAIPLAGAVCTLAAVFAKGKKSRVYTVFCKFLAAVLGLVVWVTLSKLLAGYLGKERYWIVAGLVLFGLLLLGKPGVSHAEGLKSLWSKVLGVLLFFLMLFQLPNLNPEYVLQFSQNDRAGLWQEVLCLLVFNIPFWIKLGSDFCQGQQILWIKQLALWALFFLVFLVLTATYRFPLLVQSENMFLNLGRSAVWFDKLPVRMEIPAQVVLWVTLFFALWECGAELWEPLGQRKTGKRANREKESGKEAA